MGLPTDGAEPTLKKNDDDHGSRVDVIPSERPMGSTASSDVPGVSEKPVRMWVLETPFNKRGFPVMGQFGSRLANVVIFTCDEWRRLCKNVPQLQTTQFEVGSYEE